jgi:RNA polymerase sigma factor (sigma-70 family)
MVNGGGVNPVVRYLHTFFNAQALAGLSDGQLLERFLARGDAAALEALVRRHGPMVLGVCRRVLRDPHDAEDAFQATFLVLARRAASIWPREKVGNWLYGVAYQTARKARAVRARRRVREVPASGAPEPEAASDVPRSDLAELLDHELSRLPDKYRTALVLCELEGKTHADAAERLGWPVGTLSGRLSRARALLARRLARRGVLLAGGPLAVLLAHSEGAASAGLPAPLLSSTVRAAGLFAAGRAATAGAVPSGAAALAGEVLKAMLFSKIRLTTAIAAAALLALALAGAGFRQARAWADAKAPPPKTFRVTVNEVIHDDSTVVTQIDIEAQPGSTIELSSDKDKGGGTTFDSEATDPDRPNGPSRMQLIVFADQVEGKEGTATAVKFLLGHKVGKISGSTSETVPMPAGAKQLSDLLTVPIKSGEYRYGQMTKVVTFKGVTYSLLVTAPK